MSEIYDRATWNIGLPPAAEAYCRALAMEVERLSKSAERERIVKLLETELQGPEGYRQGLLAKIAQILETP